MKIRTILFSVLCLFYLLLWATPEEIALNHPAQQHDHFVHYPPSDMPEVYYDGDEDEIIIVADGFSSYYNVLIISNSTNQTMVSTQISGYGDTIDLSSLPSDNYSIYITSDVNNLFDGQLTIL